MSIRVAISAFAHRGARRATAVQLALYSAAIALGLVLLAAWICGRAEEPPGGACYWKECLVEPQLGWSVLGLADVMALSLAALALLVLAPAAAAAQVAAERRAGTLDQLRTTPLSPLGLLGGIVVGAPAKIYLLASGPLALHVVCGLCGVVPLDSLLASLAVLATGALASVLLGVTVALAPRQETGGALAALAVAGLLGVGAILSHAFALHASHVGWAYLHPGGGLSAALLQHDGMWRRLSVSRWDLSSFQTAKYTTGLQLAPVASCVSSLALAALLAAACCRKLAAPHRPLFGKLQALVLFAGVSAGVLAPFRSYLGDYDRAPTMALVFSLMLLPLAALLGLFSAPSYEAWALALRRGRRSLLGDDAAPYATMWTMAAVLGGLVALTVAGQALNFRHDEPAALVWLVLVALTLPLYVHFLATRYPTAAARWAFGAAIAAHLIVQAIAIGLLTDSGFGFDHLFVQAAAVAGVVVPAAVLYGQRGLARRARGAAAEKLAA